MIKNTENVALPRGIVHRDLKPANVFLSDDVVGGGPDPGPDEDWSGTTLMRCVVGDFDRAVELSEEGMVEGVVGTRGYMAPEVLEAAAQYCGKSADVFSFAMLGYALMEGTEPFSHLSFAPGMGHITEAAFHRAVAEKNLRPEFSVETRGESAIVLKDEFRRQRVRELIERCWVRDPGERPNFAEIGRILDEMAHRLPPDGRGISYSPGGGGTMSSMDGSIAAPVKTPVGTRSRDEVMRNNFRITVGSALDKGRRATMEDTCFVVSQNGLAIAAIFDGHGGAGVAEFAQRWLAKHWSSIFGSVVVPQGRDSLVDPNHAQRLLTVLEVAVREAQIVGELNPDSGATGTIVVVSNSTSIHAAWLGDSAAVLCYSTPTKEDLPAASKEQRNVCHLLTAPMHTPDEISERRRIEQVGGSVSRLTKTQDDGNAYPYGPHRAYTRDGHGGLAVSRALGNLALRPVVGGKPACSQRNVVAVATPLWRASSSEQAVSGTRTSDCVGGIVPNEDEGVFSVIVASDGLWDVVSVNEVCGLLTGSCGLLDVQTGATALVRAAVERGSQDNVSAVVIRVGR